MRPWRLLVSIPLLASCATLAVTDGATSDNGVSDESGILDALVWYIIASAAPCGEKETAGIATPSSGIDFLINSFVKSANDLTGAALSPEVRSALSADQRSLCRLFGIDTDSGLEAYFSLHHVEIICPSEGLCSSYRGLRRTLRDYGRPEVDFVVNKDIEQPEAFVELSIILAPDSAGLEEVRFPASSTFKTNRCLHLVKGQSWRVVSDR